MDRAMQSRVSLFILLLLSYADGCFFTECIPWYSCFKSVSIPPSPKTTLGFAGIVTAVAAWSIWGGDMFPGEKDPTGGM